MEKRAVSSVVAITLIIALTVILSTVVFIGVKSLLQEKMSNIETCSKVEDNVLLEDLYTCYNTSSNELYFSVSVNDVKLSKISVLVESRQNSKTFEITSTPKTYPELKYLGGSYGSDLVKVPDKFSGKVYVLNLSSAGFSTYPEYISVKPYVNNEECQINLKNKLYDCKKMKGFV